MGKDNSLNVPNVVFKRAFKRSGRERQKGLSLQVRSGLGPTRSSRFVCVGALGAPQLGSGYGLGSLNSSTLFLDSVPDRWGQSYTYRGGTKGRVRSSVKTVSCGDLSR